MTDSSTPIATLMLARYPWREVYGALARMGIDRLRLRRVQGLRFWKLLGSARGLAFGAWEPRRYGIFGVWESAAALEAFERHSPVAADLRRHADELWTVRLAPLSWHGSWGGHTLFAGAQPIPALAPTDGPLAVLTRATIRPQRLRAFRAAARSVNDELAQQPGLIAAIGLGEAPLFTQATFSLWARLGDTRQFSARGPEHSAAMRRKQQERWYSEELFARFRPIASCGSWDGADPLASYSLAEAR